MAEYSKVLTSLKRSIAISKEYYFSSEMKLITRRGKRRFLALAEHTPLYSSCSRKEISTIAIRTAGPI
jgi:hypothetical protein